MSAGTASAAGIRRSRRPDAARLVPVALFLACAALYLAVGLYLALDVHYIQGDALSRVADTRSALLSRDPHMAALGFVFTPLLALVQLPLVALSGWFPVLTEYGVTAAVVTSLAMAAAVVQVHGIARDRPCPAWLRWILTAAFALHPMVVYYGGNGMSEAFFVLFVLWAVRRLVRWISTDDVHDLLLSGIALALGFLTRYDALAAAGTATLLVFALSLLHSRRWRTALLDAILLAFPTALAFLAWAAASWLVSGVALAQFSSESGNASILAASGGGSSGGLPALGFSLAEIAVLAPALGILLVAVAFAAVARRDPEPLALLVPLAVLGFATATYALGMTFPFLRFYICAVPTAVLCAVFLVPRGGPVPSRRPGPYATARAAVGESGAGTTARAGLGADPGARRGGRAVAAFAAVLLVASVPVGAYALGDPGLSQEQYALRALAPWGRGGRGGPVDESRLDAEAVLATFATERDIAARLDAMDLPDGSVIVDSMEGFPILAATRHPKRFVVPSDRDFVRILGDPAGHGVRYLLTIPPTGRGATDAINRRYPSVYANGAGVATLDLEIVNTGYERPNWRLQRVL